MKIISRIREWLEIPKGTMIMFTQSGKLSTSLIKRDGIIEPNYKLGVIIYNDDTTALEFVVNVIQKYFGLKESDAKIAANIIHLRGKVLFEVDSAEKAEHIFISLGHDSFVKGFEMKSEIVISQ